ncbi:MAG TPA: cobalamin B12-binding domain-containing protein [Gaiellaceae bacterium]|nr:cobalamin B12-binding domain-containing protein [Gaiellaceae bacterium]
MAADPRRLAAAYVEHALAGDKPRALATVLEPLRDERIELTALYDEVLAPASAHVGDLWHSGEITVADEHFSTRLTQEAMARARALAEARAQERRGRVVLACPPDEHHELGLRMLEDVLEADGWEVHALGAGTPARDLVAYVAKVRPVAVALSCGTPIAIPGLLEAVELLRAGDPGVRIVLGGRAVERYPAIAGAAGATATFTTLAEARSGIAALAG